MKHDTFLILASTAFLMMSCEKSAPPVPDANPEASDAMVFPSTLRAAILERVEITASGGGQEALLVGTGGQVVSEMALPRSGKIVAAGVQIGNFYGTSDGTLSVRICQDDKCGGGLVELGGSQDNQYLMANFNQPVEMVEGAATKLILTRTGGGTPFAIWTYPAASKMTYPDGKTVDRAPKIALDFIR